jgi:alkylhydroperoxidase family enzyme
VAGVVKAIGPLHVITTIARHRELFRAWIGLGTMLLTKGTLPARDRELAILRTAHNAACTYEWTHHVTPGRDAGLTDGEITALESGLDEHRWGPRDQAVVAAADELHFSGTLNDRSWAALTEHFDEPGLIELIMLIGHYQMIAYTLNALSVQLEAGH